MEGYHFIYVYGRDAKDKLLKAGFRLLGENEQDDYYVFENKSELLFSISDVSYRPSDILKL